MVYASTVNARETIQQRIENIFLTPSPGNRTTRAVTSPYLLPKIRLRHTIISLKISNKMKILSIISVAHCSGSCFRIFFLSFDGNHAPGEIFNELLQFRRLHTLLIPIVYPDFGQTFLFVVLYIYIIWNAWRASKNCFFISLIASSRFFFFFWFLCIALGDLQDQKNKKRTRLINSSPVIESTNEMKWIIELYIIGARKMWRMTFHNFDKSNLNGILLLVQ